MKKTAAALCFILISTFAFAQSLQDLVIQAKTRYAEGQYQQAVALVDTAASSFATDFANKTIIADTYNEIGEKEAAKKNLLNAYECYRKAVRIYPTHKAASENFWKIKQNYDVAALKNEGSSSSVVVATPVPDKTAPPTGTDTTGAVDTGTYTAAQLADLKKYQAELNRQAELIKQLQAATSSRSAAADPNTTAYNKAILDNLTKLYQNAVNRRDTSDLDIISAQMKEYRQMFESQQSSQSTLIWAVLLSFIGLILVIVVTLLVFYRIARTRRKQRFAYAANYGIGLGENNALSIEDQQTLLIGQDSPLSETPAREKTGMGQETDFYRDVIKAERLKEMANEKKYGSLKWETLRGYIGELEKELRSEILYVVENKLNSFEGEDYASILPVLFPFFTDSDEYLRDKAHRLLEKAISTQGAPDETFPQLEYDEAGKKKAKDPLSVPALLRHVDKLRNIKPARREHSINVAKYTRGMGMALKLPKETQELLYKTALVHDIGYALLDQGKLEEIAEKKEMTDKESDFIQTHPEKGIVYFKEYDIPEEMKQGILYHHERNDGSGYPKGLEREKIPMFAKIIGIADVFDALTTNRVFREKMSYDSAVAILQDLGRSKIEADYLRSLIEYLKSSGKIKR